jgi:hypothetical protein
MNSALPTVDRGSNANVRSCGGRGIIVRHERDRDIGDGINWPFRDVKSDRIYCAPTPVKLKMA